MRVKQLANNQFIISMNNGSKVFQSYNSIIAINHNNGEKIELSEHYDYSRTTMKYLNQFLGHGIAETRKRLESGEYTLSINTDGQRIGK